MKSKYCLSIETSGDYLGLGLAVFGQKEEKVHVKDHFYSKMPGQQSDFLIPEMDRLLKKNKVRKEELNLIAANVGPGSFTGIRVGVSVARALAQGLKIPAVGLSGLEMMALQAKSKILDLSQNQNVQTIVSFFPALPGELYYAAFQTSSGKKGSWRNVIKPQWAPWGEFKKDIHKFNLQRLIFTGNRTEKIEEFLGEHYEPLFKVFDNWVHPSTLCLEAIHQYQRFRRDHKWGFSKLIPLYLQPSWAERKKT